MQLFYLIQSTLPRIFLIRVTRIRVTSWSLVCVSVCKHAFQVLLSIFLCKEITALASTIVSSSRLELPALDCMSFTTGVALSLSFSSRHHSCCDHKLGVVDFPFPFCSSTTAILVLALLLTTTTRNSVRILKYYQNKGEYNSITTELYLWHIRERSYSQYMWLCERV